MPTSLLPILLIVHVSLAVSLFLPSVLLPFALRAQSVASESTGPAMRSLLWLQSSGTIFVGIGLAVTGVLLVVTLGSSLLSQPWLLIALLVYAVNLLIAFFIQRPNLRGLLGIRASRDDRVWAARARQQRYVSYLMAGFVGIVGFLMSTKPALW
ncbi:MAG: hypothetical protein ABI598_06565 [Chloroflexota bacterium]